MWMTQRFKMLSATEESILIKAIRLYEAERTEAAFHSLVTLIDRYLETYNSFYERMEFRTSPRGVYDPDMVDAWVNLALDLKDEKLFHEFARLKRKVST